MISFLSQCFLFLQFFSAGIHDAEPVANKVNHPFYVSVTEINWNGAEKTLEISCKFFTDDFEHTLEKNYNAQLDIYAAKDKTVLDKYIADYINKHLHLSVEAKAVKLNYVGFEKEKESVYCYFEVTNVSALNKLDITNKLLYDFTKEQINIMHVTANGKRQTSKLNYPEEKVSVQF